MPVTSLFSLFRINGWGRQSEQQIDVVYLAASASTTATITPAAGYYGMVVHYITFHRVLPNAFSIAVSQDGVARHSVVLSTDLVEVSFWAWVTVALPLIVVVTNRTPFNATLGVTLATLNFTDRQEMEDVLKRATAFDPLAGQFHPISPAEGRRRAVGAL